MIGPIGLIRPIGHMGPIGRAERGWGGCNVNPHTAIPGHHIAHRFTVQVL